MRDRLESNSRLDIYGGHVSTLQRLAQISLIVRLVYFMIERSRNKEKTKRFLKWIVIVGIIVIFMIVSGVNLYMATSTKTRLHTEIKNLPKHEFGLVMGTDLLRFNGSTNLHFLNRTEGAAQVYMSGKVAHLLISGNKNNKGFDEVTGMEEMILSKGIPKAVLILDFDGNTTWESAKRARQIYHLQTVTIITDTFHAPRAIYLCRHFGIDADAFCYGDESIGFWSLRYHAREWFARVKAVLQVLID
jgi:SanA protein